MAGELQKRTDHEITIITKDYHETPDEEYEYNLVRVPTWHLTPKISTLSFIISSLFYILWNRTRIDIIHSMMIYPNGFVGYVCNRFTGIAYFAWIRGGDYYFMKDTLGKRWLIKRVLADTRVLVQTERIADDVYSEFPEASLTVLGNGIEIPEETATGDDVVFVGRLKQQKGVHVLLQAAAELDEPLRIVGDGPERTRLEDLADRLGVNANFVGEVPPEEVNKHLCHGKVFVLPSVRGEGLPNAALEAMAVGLPIVVTDTGGVADAVVSGHTGYVVEAGNVDALKQQLGYLCENDTQRSEMGSQARQWVRDNYGWDHICAELESLYESLVK